MQGIVIRRALTPERGFGLMRTYLGVGLLARGLLLFETPGFVGERIGWGESSLVPHSIALAHVFGGALLAVGLYARLAAAVQIVPVLGALVTLHAGGQLASADQSFEFSSLVLVMLICFAWFGAGDWSLDARRGTDDPATSST